MDPGNFSSTLSLSPTKTALSLSRPQVSILIVEAELRPFGTQKVIQSP